MEEMTFGPNLSINNYKRLFAEEFENQESYPMILVKELGKEYEIIKVAKEEISNYRIVGNVPQEDVIEHSTGNNYNFVSLDTRPVEERAPSI